MTTKATSKKSKAVRKKRGAISVPPIVEPPVTENVEAMPELIEGGSGWEKTLDLWEDKLKRPEAYQVAPIQAWQVKYLQKYRPHLFQDAISAGDDMAVNIEGGYRGVANWVRNNFAGRLSRVPSHTDIQNWNKGDYLPAGCKENFPSSDANNGRYKTAEVRAWVEKFLFKAENGQEVGFPLDDRQRKERADARMAELELEQFERESSNKYVLTEIANRTGTAIGMAARNSVRVAFEKNLVRQSAAGLLELIPNDALRLKVTEKLRATGVELFAKWQAEFAAELEGLMKRNLEAKA